MKKKEKTSLHTMNPEELGKVISESKTKLAQFLVNRYSKQSKNVHEGTMLRRKIAVASTIKRMKELTHE